MKLLIQFSILLLLLTTMCGCANYKNESVKLHRSSTPQKENKANKTYRTAFDALAESQDPDQRLQAYFDCQSLIFSNPDQFAVALLDYVGQEPSSRRAMVATLVLLSRTDVPRIVTPTLADYLRKPEWKKTAVLLLDALDPTGDHNRNLYGLRTYFVGSFDGQKALPSEIIVYSIEKSPTEAFELIAPVVVRKSSDRNPLLMMNHLVASFAIAQEAETLAVFRNSLATLLKPQLENALKSQQHLLVRLYVAEILKRHSELRTPELVKTLQADTNEYVKAAVAAWDKKDAP